MAKKSRPAIARARRMNPNFGRGGAEPPKKGRGARYNRGSEKRAERDARSEF